MTDDSIIHPVLAHGGFWVTLDHRSFFRSFSTSSETHNQLPWVRDATRESKSISSFVATCCRQALETQKCFSVVSCSSNPNCAFAAWDIHYHNLDLHLLEAVLPDNDVRGDTVIAVVE